ncbi:MAG: hypothetical protein IJ841_00010 [Prevotella sp.]|nr:hypothetical protein [Prevotella sp.]
MKSEKRKNAAVRHKNMQNIPESCTNGLFALTLQPFSKIKAEYEKDYFLVNSLIDCMDDVDGDSGSAP